LPTHDQSTANSSWAVLCGVDWDSRGFGAHANTKKDTGDEELDPILSNGGADDGDETKDGGEEDGATTAEEVV